MSSRIHLVNLPFQNQTHIGNTIKTIGPANCNRRDGPTKDFGPLDALQWRKGTGNLIFPHRVPFLLGISLSSSGLDLAPICDFVAAVDGSIFLGPVGGGLVGLVGVWADGCGTHWLVFGGSISA